MATTSITPDMEANVTGVERAEEQRFQHARDCEGNHDSDNHTKQRHASCTKTSRAERRDRTASHWSGTASEQRAAVGLSRYLVAQEHPGIDRQMVRLLEPEAER